MVVLDNLFDSSKLKLIQREQVHVIQLLWNLESHMRLRWLYYTQNYNK